MEIENVVDSTASIVQETWKCICLGTNPKYTEVCQWCDKKHFSN